MAPAMSEKPKTEIPSRRSARQSSGKTKVGSKREGVPPTKLHIAGENGPKTAAKRSRAMAPPMSEKSKTGIPSRRSARMQSLKTKVGPKSKGVPPTKLHKYIAGENGPKTAAKRHDTTCLLEKTSDEENSPNSSKVKQEEMDGNGELSAYELERLENIRQNKAFLSSMEIFPVSKDLKQSVQPKPSQRGLGRSKPAVKEMPPPRKSLRLQHKKAETSTPLSEPQDVLTHEYFRPCKKPSGPLPMKPANVDEGSELPPELLNLCSEESVKEEKMDLDLKEYRSTLKKMSISENRVAKVVKHRIFSAAFHPCTSSLLMATGDKWGNVGLWNIGGDWGDDGVLVFEPHIRPVGCMAFSRTNPAHLLSLSYDGSMRCMDIHKACFDDVYNIEDGLKTFDFLTPDCATLVIGDWHGQVAIVDRRTPGNSHESLHTMDPKCVRCVNVHPLHRQYFAVAESRVVGIYDSRCLKKTKSQAVSQLLGHSLSISSAYFSPSTGNRVLTSCLDNKIRVYDTSTLTSKVPLLTSISHDMRTGRWLSKLSAVWDPKREDCFVVGSMARPRRVEVFHERGELQHSFRNPDHLNTVMSVTAFHPTRNALLGGNNSGRLHIFAD